MPETRTGGCHCGRVRYEVVNADLNSVLECNCSICTKRGSLLIFVPTAQFTLRAGAEDLTDYQFARKTVHHVFCRNCGISSYAQGTAPDGSEMIAINVRCLDGVDIGAMETTPFDGRSL